MGFRGGGCSCFCVREEFGANTIHGLSGGIDCAVLMRSLKMESGLSTAAKKASKGNAVAKRRISGLLTITLKGGENTFKN
jgi:hypothetical protein